MSKKVILGMSGGVDSSYALCELKKAGFDVYGVFLKYDTWTGCKSENSCCSKESLKNAEKICNHFDCPLETVDVSSEFNKEVVGYFKESVGENKTPSPCVLCNQKVKFFQLLKYADSVGADYIATGHYAQIDSREKTDGTRFYHLLRAKDRKKDQTYSLSFLTQKQLSRIIFPLGGMTKEDVYREISKIPQMSFYQKIKQSQDFCFLGKDELPEFIKKEIKTHPGNIVNTDGEVLGKHPGLEYFTIGQRKMLGLPGGPFYVVEKRLDKSELVVSKDEGSVLKDTMFLSPYNLISEDEADCENVKVSAKIRSSAKESDAVLSKSDKGLKIEFAEPQFAPAPGQVVVFYKDDVCLGGGIIKQV